jgi:hypothetical protein
MKGVYYVVDICCFVFMRHYLCHSLRLCNIKTGDEFISTVI